MSQHHAVPSESRRGLVVFALLIVWPILIVGCPREDGLDDDHDSDGPALPCSICHSSPQNERRAVVALLGPPTHPFGYGSLADDSCELCHEMTRHRQGKVRLWDSPFTQASVIELDGDPSSVSAEADKLTPFCGGCHGDSHYGVHAVGGDWRPACVTCHDLHDPDGTNRSLVSDVVHNQTLGQDKPVVFTARTGANSFDDGDPSVNDGICQVCHTTTNYHLHDGSGTSHNDSADCTACHLHSGGFIPAGGTSCIACHSTSQGSRPAVVNADGTRAHHLGGGVLTDADCVVCHETTQHQQGQVRVWSDPNNPTTALALTGDPAELVSFCTACHDSLTHPAIHSVSGSWDPACTECHELHDPSNVNLSLVSGVVHNQTLGQDKPVVFTARTGANSFDDGDPSVNDGICQVCHTTTNYHLHDGSGTSHNDGADCTACHSHDGSFQPTGGSCSDCHVVAQDNGDGVPSGGRRAVVGEFGLASHHLQGASLDDADCEVCHDMSQHQQGYVRLKEVDDPSNPAAVIVLNDDPSVNQTEAAKLEAFCLACHDSDGAGGSVPFTDGLTPVAIDAAAWAGASHKTGGGVQLTCFGDGASFGCHSSGHGSNKRKLLAPYGVAPTPPANAEEEEAFCFTCHDADGPASSDIKSRFDTTIRWVSGAVGANPGNVNLNDRHDVQYEAQSQSGAKVECTDCHDPHSATQAAPLKSDPDPTDGRTPGTGQVLAGADFQTEWCLDCHDGGFPGTVTPPSTALTDIRDTFQNDDDHGLSTAGNPGLKSGYGWAKGDLVPCLACHTQYHASSKRNLFHVKDTVKSEDGSTDIPSDNVGLNYELTDNNVVDPPTNGWEWCNTCHTGSMGDNKSNCFTCHYHGRRF